MVNLGHAAKALRRGAVSEPACRLGRRSRELVWGSLVVLSAFAWCLAGAGEALAEEAPASGSVEGFIDGGAALAGNPAAPRARGHTGNWYISTSAAAFIADENNLIYDKIGRQGSLMVGRKLFDGRFRLEAEISERRVGLTGLNGASRARGELIAQVAFLNGYVQARPEADWDAYLGGGVGWGRQSHRLVGRADRIGSQVSLHDQTESFASHVMGGVERRLTPRTSLLAEGRFLILRDKALQSNIGCWNGIERSYQLGVGISRSF